MSAEREPRISVGIDVAEARHGLDLVGIDQHRRIVAAHCRLSLAAAVNLVHELQPAVVCIDSPAQWAVAGASREAERALRRLGVISFSTPSTERAVRFHDWMRAGFAVYDALLPAYPRYKGGPVTGTAAEFFPHASSVALAGRIGPLKDKSAFRRRVLGEHGVDTSALRSLDQLDAALGALTGIIALAGEHTWVGEAEEGALLLPVRTLPARWLRDGSAGAAPARSKPTPHSASATPMANRTCGCGCGAAVTREFRPGHDAKLRSRLLKEVTAGAQARAELERRHWV